MLAALLSFGSAQVALAADPLLDGLPGADAVVIRRGPDRWTVTVRGRSATLPPVVTEADRVALRALVTSLLSDLDLSSPDAATGASVALALLGTPPPRRVEEAQASMALVPETEPKKLAPMVPAAVETPSLVAALPELAPGPVRFAPFAPTLSSPPASSAHALLPEPAIALDPPALARWSPELAPWVGAELLTRPQTSAALGVVLGLDLGDRVAARMGLRPVRQIEVERPAGDSLRTGFGELAVDLLCCGHARPLRVQWGGGVALRRYTTGKEVRALHAVPRAVAQLGREFRPGSWRIEPQALLEVDLLPTYLGWSSADRSLFPVAVGFDLKIGRAFEPETPEATPEGKPLQRGDP